MQAHCLVRTWKGTRGYITSATLWIAPKLTRINADEYVKFCISQSFSTILTSNLVNPHVLLDIKAIRLVSRQNWQIRMCYKVSTTFVSKVCIKSHETGKLQISKFSPIKARFVFFSKTRSLFSPLYQKKFSRALAFEVARPARSHCCLYSPRKWLSANEGARNYPDECSEKYDNILMM